jgi:type I restriction enzyme S subunit
MMFYKETEFQDSPVGKIPEDWKGVRINQISEVHRGASPRPIGDSKYFSETGRGWIRISDVTNTYKYLRNTSQYLSELGESKSVKVDPGDLVMSICATIGTPIIIDMKACIHDGFVVFRNLSKDVDTEFLFYVLEKNEHRFRSMKQTGTQGNLNTTLVGETFIPIPSISEQRAVVRVLGVVDSAIGLVDEVIWKTERLKKGLMRQLLTRGIGHKEYKDTPIGKIPKAWDIVALGEICGFLDSMRIPLKVQDRAKRKGPYPYYGAQGIIDWIDGYLFDGEHVLLAEDGENLRSKKLPIAFKVGGKFWVNNHAHVLKLTSDRVATDFIVYMLNFINIRPHIVGSAQPKLNQSEARKISLPLPPLSEQEKIVSAISDVDKKLDLEKKQKTKLESIKRGMMDMLLTGKVRVKVD